MNPDDPGKNRSWWNATSARYEAAHGGQLTRDPCAWGAWQIPEAELGILGDVEGRDVLEFGCGAARWSIALAQRGARVVGMDLSEAQLARARELAAEAGIPVPLVHANGERAPFADGSFDVVFCDHGATTWARPDRTVAEASRLLRSGGRFAFNVSSPLFDLCWGEGESAVGTRLARDYFDLDRIDEGDCVSFQRPYGAWIRLFRTHGFAVEDLVELRPPPDGSTTYGDYVDLGWARRWPAENVWKLTKEP